MAEILYCASSWRHIAGFHLPYIRALELAGHRVWIAAPDMPQGSPYHCAGEWNIEKRALSFQNLKAVFALAGIVRRKKITAVSVHTTLAAFLCRLALLLPGCRRVEVTYVCHGYFFELDSKRRIKKSLPSLFYFFCEKLLAKRTDRLLLMNQEDYGSARRYELGREVSMIAGMGLERSKLPPCREQELKDFRQRWSISPGMVVFACVAEFSKRKNQALVLQAFADACPALRKAGYRPCLLFAGDGALLADCRELAERLGIWNYVRFCGQLGHLAPFYAACDVLVCASRSEGLPFNVMEAQHYGVPVVASRIKGHVDLIRHGKQGMLFNPDDSGELTRCMVSIGTNAELREAMRANSGLQSRFYLEQALPAVLGEEFSAALGQVIAR